MRRQSYLSENLSNKEQCGLTTDRGVLALSTLCMRLTLLWLNACNENVTNQSYNWLNEENLSCCTCGMQCSSFLWHISQSAGECLVLVLFFTSYSPTSCCLMLIANFSLLQGHGVFFKGISIEATITLLSDGWQFVWSLLEILSYFLRLCFL